MRAKNTRLGLRLSLLGSLMTLVVALATASPGNAATSTKAIDIDEFAKTQCALSVTSANYADGTARVRLNASTTWSTFAGYRELVSVSVRCDLYSESEPEVVIASIYREGGPRTINAAGRFTVPLDFSYEVCVAANYTLRNGDSTSLFGCS